MTFDLAWLWSYESLKVLLLSPYNITSTINSCVAKAGSETYESQAKNEFYRCVLPKTKTFLLSHDWPQIIILFAIPSFLEKFVISVQCCTDQTISFLILKVILYHKVPKQMKQKTWNYEKSVPGVEFKLRKLFILIIT